MFHRIISSFPSLLFLSVIRYSPPRTGCSGDSEKKGGLNKINFIICKSNFSFSSIFRSVNFITLFLLFSTYYFLFTLFLPPSTRETLLCFTFISIVELSTINFLFVSFKSFLPFYNSTIRNFILHLFSYYLLIIFRLLRFSLPPTLLEYIKRDIVVFYINFLLFKFQLLAF